MAPSAWEANALREPSPGLEPGTSFVPGTRSGHWSYEGVENVLEPPPGPEPGTFRLQGGCAADCAKEAVIEACVRSAGLEPAQPSRTTGTSGQRVYLIPPRTHGAAIRCRPGSSAVRRRSRSRARRQSYPPWIRTRNLRVQSAALLPIELEGIEYGRRDSNAQAASFELTRSGRLPSLPRTPPRNRTPLCGLRVRSITTMLAARESRWDRTSDLRSFKPPLCRLS
jgi:hypothetical protein